MPTITRLAPITSFSSGFLVKGLEAHSCLECRPVGASGKLKINGWGRRLYIAGGNLMLYVNHTT